MPHVIVVNPSARKSKGVRKMARKKARSAAQKAATRKMIAANKARRGGSHSKRKTRRASTSHTVRTVHVMPRKTHRRKAHRKHARTSAKAASSAGRALRFRRTNPVGFLSDFTSMIVPSAIGGAGALGVDVLLGLPFIPDTIKTGPMRPVVRVGGAIALGFLTGMVASKRTAHQVTAGALTVVLYDVMKGALAKVAGGKIPGIGVYEIPGVGMYEVNPQPALGYTDSGMQVGETQFSPDETTVAEYVSGDEPGVYR